MASMRHLVSFAAFLLSFGCRAAAPDVRAPQRAAPAESEVGSLRNARVAIERRDADAPLVYFARELEPGEREEIARVAPHLRLEVGLSREQALARASEAHGVDVSYATPEFLRAATNLAWVQAHSAGVDRYVSIPELRDNDRVVLTNMRGVHGPAIADHVFAMLLTLTRDLPAYLDARKDGRWSREGSGELRPIALEGRTLLVVGLGGIGTEIARRGHGFGMHVIATRRSETPAPEFVERCGRADELLAMLPQADVVAIAVPLTPETERLFDARAFAAMKPGSYLVNIARGKVVDTGALLDALSSKRLAGACLDVTDPEPLPADHPLWRLPNVVITPHVASNAELTDERARALFVENLRRFDAGEPLYNVVDKLAGY
jgi:phosphoglycerate dehydrogenase-like enzyme